MASILDRDELNAFCRHTHSRCQAPPKGQLAGLTFGVKDILRRRRRRYGVRKSRLAGNACGADENCDVVEALAGGRRQHRRQNADRRDRIQHQRYQRSLRPNDQSKGGGQVERRLLQRIRGGGCWRAVRLRARSRYRRFGAPAGEFQRSLWSAYDAWAHRHEGARTLAPSFDTAGWFARDFRYLLGSEMCFSPGLGAWPEFKRGVIAEDALRLSTPASGTLNPCGTG